METLLAYLAFVQQHNLAETAKDNKHRRNNSKQIFTNANCVLDINETFSCQHNCDNELQGR